LKLSSCTDTGKAIITISTSLFSWNTHRRPIFLKSLRDFVCIFPSFVLIKKNLQIPIVHLLADKEGVLILNMNHIFIIVVVKEVNSILSTKEFLSWLFLRASNTEKNAFCKRFLTSNQTNDSY
jgi:hypothetical protein